MLDGIRFMSSELTKGNLLIDRSCENLLRELPSYTWDEEKSIKRGEDVPLKENDHAVDAVRYVLYTHCGHGPAGIVASIMV